MTDPEFVADQNDQAAEQVPDQAEGTGSEQPPAWTDQDETEARAFGWKPASEWKGDVPAGFIDDPKAYLDRASSFGPFRKAHEKIDALVQRDNQREEQFRKMQDAMAKQIERQQKQAQADFEAKLEGIRQGQRQAVENADQEQFDRLEREREGLKAPEPVEIPKEEAPQHDPVAAYGEQHPWVKDPALMALGAQVLERAFRAGTAPQDGAAQVRFAEAELKRMYPALFQAPAPKPSPVDGAQIMPRGKKEGFDTLPKEVKSEFKRMVGLGIFKDTDADKAEYFHDYQNA